MSERDLRQVKKYLESDELTERQRETIQRFDKHKVDLRHWKSVHTRISYAKNLYFLGIYCPKPYEDMTEEDIINFLDSKNINERTRNSYIIHFRTFFRWLYGLPEGHYPECVSDLKPQTLLSELTKSDLISDEDMKNMIRCASPNHRDPAIPPVLKETCFRPGEFLSMNIGDVEERDFGFSVTCRKSKTVTRSVPLVISARYLAAWLNHHPYRDNPEAPLWISLARNRFGKRLEIHSLNTIVIRLARRAGIKKRVYSYLFRHSGITYYAAEGKSDAQLRLIAGWSRTSTMPSRYTHLAGVDAENAILDIHGLRKRKSQPLLKPKVCPRCDEENNPEMTYCGKCATNLDRPLENMSDYKELLRDVSEMKKILRDILEKGDGSLGALRF